MSPHLSLNTEPLRALLKKENCFAWDENTNTCFQKIKSQLQEALLRPLRYYDWSKPVTLQCDASLKGLGACIIQNRQPIMFASKSLMDTETRYANIERELLAIVYGCEKFHTYLYSRTFIVEMDHKPLGMISLKNLTVAPAQLQRMLLCLQQYDLVITYQPGREMLLADALSCLPSRTNTKIKLDPMGRHHIYVCLLPKMSHQDCSRDSMGPHPLNVAQTHPEWLARQTRSCPQSGQILLELLRQTLHRW